jgi:hypothetical protein
MNTLNPDDLIRVPDDTTTEAVGIRPELRSVQDEMRAVIEEMYRRQEVMESELARTKAALDRALNGKGSQASVTEETGGPPAMSALMQNLIESLAANRINPDKESTAPRGWKPPTWDGRAEAFRDYLLRLRSSYRVRSAAKPTLSMDFYWNTIYDTLPARERARMRHFWERGSATKGKDPEAFFAQLEKVFADSNERTKALERLTSMKHSLGQPWHEHQLEFDELLLTSGGDSWEDSAKIGHLRNTFSNPARLYTASMPRMTDYYEFAEEVERIMINLEETDQFKTSNKKWREKNQNYQNSSIYSAGSQNYQNPSIYAVGRARSYDPQAKARANSDEDTVMTPTSVGGYRAKNNGERKGFKGKQRAKWVDAAEREKRREKGLCFRCGANGHRIAECPYAAAVRPAAINAVGLEPLLEDDLDFKDSVASESGKE